MNTLGPGFYKITVRQPWFDLIKSGKKTAEGRLNRGLFAKLKVGDIVQWQQSDNPANFVNTTVVNLRKYATFADMLAAERLKNTLPVDDINTINKGLKEVYHKIYKHADEQKFGVVAIRLQVVTGAATPALPAVPQQSANRKPQRRLPPRNQQSRGKPRSPPQK